MSTDSSTHELLVLGAGFPRTGTLSLRTALNALGFKCYHMADAFENPKDFEEWSKLSKVDSIQRKSWNWNDIYSSRNYTAAVDSPTSDFWDLIYDYYQEKKRKNHKDTKDKDKDTISNVKVILTIRDTPDQWHNSLMRTVIPIHDESNRWFTRWLNPKRVDAIGAIIWNGTFEGKPKDKEFAIKKYLERIEDVKKKKIPSEDLLIYNVKEGWKPLCDFLHKDIPIDEKTGDAMKFPMVNSTEEFQTRIQPVKRMNNLATATISFVGVIGLAIGGFYVWKRT